MGYTVGQRVHVRDVNERRLGGARMGEVVKIGRTLVTVREDGPYGREQKYRIETGQTNDAYGHGYIQTEDEFRDATKRSELWSRLQEHRVTVPSSVSLAKLEAIVAILDSES